MKSFGRQTSVMVRRQMYCKMCAEEHFAVSAHKKDSLLLLRRPRYHVWFHTQKSTTSGAQVKTCREVFH